MGYFSVTASGTGVSGTTLPHSGTVTFTIKMIGPEDDYDARYIYTSIFPTDENNNVLTENLSSSEMGANLLSYEYINNYNDTTKYASVDMAKFKSACSAYSNLAGLLFQIHTQYSEYEKFYFQLLRTACREPTSPKLSATLSRDAVKLSWGAGSAGMNNSVTGYDVQRRESTDGNNWGSWENVPGSPVTTTEMNVSPPNTAGNYYQYQVRTRGSAGSNYYSGWVTGTTGETTLRRDHDALAGFTDDPLIVNISPVKALHMQELQSRANTLRTFYGLNAYSFTTITAGTTSLAGWTTHVNQIRTAIEDVCNASGKTHESWIPFSVNCPRADVIQQLRRVILAL